MERLGLAGRLFLNKMNKLFLNRFYSRLFSCIIK
jgi:hypothetical protein